MSELRPYPFRALVSRMLRELEERGAVFDLPLEKGFFGAAGRDLSALHHGRRASSPFGPAAGPHTQMAQNLVLCWLAGGRVLELKTIQVRDRLEIPRPCIDMQTVGYNVEWSQELRLEESLEEYVKASMLIEILRASGGLPLETGFDRTLFELSVGYDLSGLRSEAVRAFLGGALDCAPLVDRLRAEIPEEHRRFRDLDFESRLTDAVTLSTFHGCPPHEIEGMCELLLVEHGLDVVLKLNPTLLGPERVRELLAGELGFEEIRVPDGAFESDPTFEEAAAMVEWLVERARGLGRGFGAKLTNTLVVENHRDFFPADVREMYLSGPPLHVLAMHALRRFRRRLGDSCPFSFSAGIDRKNFADAVALGLVPVTVCTDLLKPGGYARGRGYHSELLLRMERVGAASLGDFAIRAFGRGAEALARIDPPPSDPRRGACERALAEGAELLAAAGEELYARWVSQAHGLNTEAYVPTTLVNPRYQRAHNSKVPRKIGSRLELFDCISCDKCLPVCPNAANFTFVLPKLDVPVLKLRREGDGWITRTDGRLVIEEDHQIGTFADFCNDCGNCDVFCPEDGGPYAVKPRFFGRLEDWQAFRHLDGFHLERRPGGDVLRARIGGEEVRLQRQDDRILFSGKGFELSFDESDPAGTAEGTAEVEVDLTWGRVLEGLQEAVYGPDEINHLACL